MLYFLYRQSMFIHPVSKEGIVAFMHGINFGKQKQPYWTDLLKKFISEKYGINGGAFGWPHQLDLYCELNELTWIDCFKKLMLELIEEYDAIPYPKRLKRMRDELDAHTEEIRLKYSK